MHKITIIRYILIKKSMSHVNTSKLILSVDMSSLHILSWLVMARNRDNVNIKLDGLMYANCPFILWLIYLGVYSSCVQGLVQIHTIAFSTTHVSSPMEPVYKESGVAVSCWLSV